MGRGSFTSTVTVSPADCLPAGGLSPAAALRLLQEAAGAGIESVGLGHDVLLQTRGLIFMVAAHAVRFARPAVPGEALTVHTDPAVSRGAHMIRETRLFSADGSLLAEGQSDWILVDAETGLPHRSSELAGELDALPVWHPFCDPSRLKIPAAETPCGEYPVTPADTDVNGHMNNAVYAALLQRCLREEETVGEFAIRYRSQLFPGDTVTLCRDGETISGRRGGEACFTAYARPF